MSGWGIAACIAGGVVLGLGIAYVGLAFYFAKGMFR
jgi:hypothetical protein